MSFSRICLPAARNSFAALPLAALLLASLPIKAVCAENIFDKIGKGIKGAAGDVFSADDSSRLERRKTKEAWEFIDEQLNSLRFSQPPRMKPGAKDIFGKPVDQGAINRNHAQMVAKRTGELEEIKKKATTDVLQPDVSLKTLNLLSDEMASQLGNLLSAAVQDRKPKEGSQFALVIGKFVFRSNNRSRGSAPSDKEDERFSKRVADRINNAPIGERFATITRDAQDATALINDLGGGSSKWISEDGRNYRDVVVQNYHPDDIFLLTGEVSREFDGSYTLTFETTCGSFIRANRFC